MKINSIFEFSPPLKIALPMILLGILALFGSGFSDTLPNCGPKPKLSDYPFFSGKLNELAPAPNVFEYEVNAPLFSDYAEKKRFIYLPEGTQLGWQDFRAFDFPTGAVIIKNFYYWHDVAHPEKGRRILETRLLLKEANGWKALEYVWDDAQTDAFLDVAGAHLPVTWLAANGKKTSIDYVTPNLNQCKGCHSYDGQFEPIGITARQLNRTENGENQLLAWQASGRLNLPENFDIKAIPALFDYRSIRNPEKETAESLNAAARGYLDANCAHCHNPHGPASTSGMFLGVEETNMERLGVGKPPVAAGRGSGNRKYGIVPGKPAESILYFRMENDDPGIRMPELGRQMGHKEGLEIVKNWIKSL